jgi:hypothetical protein
MLAPMRPIKQEEITEPDRGEASAKLSIDPRYSAGKIAG